MLSQGCMIILHWYDLCPVRWTGKQLSILLCNERMDLYPQSTVITSDVSYT